MSSKILIVDDDRQILEHLQELLRNQGYQVSFIPRGEFLFPRLESGDFDLVLLDINLPGKNGLELLREMKALPAYADLPVIMITGEDERQTLASCYELGAIDYIRKPVNEVALKARVRTAIFTKRYHEQRLELERKKALQSRMAMLSAQMNPHFIFNALNSIQFFLMENDTAQAIHYLSEFSGLMRRTLENSTRPYIPVTEEISFLKIYLQLEKERFQGGFDYEIIDELSDPDYTFIPPMLLQPYIENAIVHGFKQIGYPGKLTVHFRENEDIITCTIRDNGIGRKAARELRSVKSHRSVAMSNTQTRLELLNSTHGATDFRVEIRDLYDGERAAGTEVVVCFPGDLH
ncbi:MAG: response regulator [Saprospiraceae bacterium]